MQSKGGSTIPSDRQLRFGRPPDYYTQNKPHKFCSNFIKTSRYNIITFLPFSLFLQFTRVANLYFLIIAVLQCFPVISPLNPSSAIAPLVFVVSLSMARDGYEDWQRHKSDNEMNSSQAKIYTGRQDADKAGFSKLTWKDVQIGDLVYVQDHEIIASDLVVIASALDTGQCFIETSSLDGEKNLKPKQAITELQERMMKEGQPVIPANFEGKIQCILPNAMLYQFDGVMYYDNQKLALNHKHLVLRGSRLKNLKWILGVTVYTGQDTKIMRNSDEGKPKVSNIDRKANMLIFYILLIQIGCCSLLSITFGITCSRGSATFNTFNDTNYSCSANSLIVFAAYFLLLNTFIPISLIVSLEFVKVAQGYFMERDLEMYSAENDKMVKVFSTSINEELGQVQYIFSDKTGTLTCNRMEFKICVCGSMTYGDMSIFTEQEQTSFVQNQILRMQPNSRLNRAMTYTDKRAGIDYNFESLSIENALHENDPQKNPELNYPFWSTDGVQVYTLERQSDLVRECLMLLASAHECVLETDEETGETRYQGPSPDEIALVDAARRMGFVYKGISMNKQIIECEGHEEQVELLKSFEFNSDRKRMSVIIKQGGVYKFYVKGADSIIKARLAKNKPQPFLQGINERLDFFAKKGLRTLCLALRVLTEAEYKDFDAKLSACLGQNDCESKQQEIIEEMENGFMLLGVTAVEDKLQDDVPETLADFLKANINVWMLTGDKLETAENIGRSCNLVQNDMKVFYITPETDAAFTLNEVAIHVQSGTKQKRALIIEGLALVSLQKSTELESMLVLLAPSLHSVICCRVTPKQKADMVRLVKTRLGKITLAVGDGANDVNMIQEAHIGIGIYGQEGMRAVQASNYAIGQFKCLWKLVLYHGRLNYIRIAEMILYFFYKNIIFTVPQFFFAFFCFYSGQSIFDDFYIVLYNTVFTFWPVVIRAVFDEDLYYTRQKKSTIYGSKRLSIAPGSAEIRSANDILRQHYPRLYYIGQKNRIFTTARFFKWFAIGVLQGAVCFFCFYFELDSDLMFSEKGYTADIWFVSISIYSSIMILVTLKLSLNTQFWTVLTWIAYMGTSLGAYFAYVFISSELPFSQVYHTSGAVFTSGIFYLSLALNVLAMFAFDLVLFTFKTSKDTLLNYFKQVARSDQDFDIEKIHELNLRLEEELRRGTNADSKNLPTLANNLSHNSSILSVRSDGEPMNIHEQAANNIEL